jgi:flagellar L-ring protein precursor FlgH
MRLSRTALAFAAFVPLAACGSMKEAVNGPSLTPMAYPAAQMLTPPQVMGQAQMVPMQNPAAQASANSLWRTGSRAFFNDPRASKTGDILTVLIAIRDNAQLQNQTSTSRETSVDTGVSSLFGLESKIDKVLPGSPDPAHLITSGSSSTVDGQGSVNRSEAVSLTIAAVVSGVLANGNMIIQGKQEVRINQELRELTVTGIVRPEDITAGNTIRHTQIAEARISYGGRGAVTRVQRVPFGQALVEQFTPF